MTSPVITIPGATLLHILDTRGWVQGRWEASDGRVCAHQAIRLCQPVPGDAYLTEKVAAQHGWGTDWNDSPLTTEATVRARLGGGIHIYDTNLADTFGPQWRAVVALVRRAAVLTEGEAGELDAARAAAGAAAWDAAGYAAWAAAWDAAGDAAGAAARAAARDAAGYAAWDAAGDAAGAAARAAAWDAARAAVTWDLATPDGPYTTAQRDLLMTPWATVCGLPDGLVTA